MHKHISEQFDKWCKQSESIELTDRDFNKLLEMIDNPPAPNENLKRAMKRYEELNK